MFLSEKLSETRHVLQSVLIDPFTAVFTAAYSPVTENTNSPLPVKKLLHTSEDKTTRTEPLVLNQLEVPFRFL